jgi:hypothetical protein
MGTSVWYRDEYFRSLMLKADIAAGSNKAPTIAKGTV